MGTMADMRLVDLALADVMGDTEHADEVAGGVEQRRGVGDMPTPVAILMADTILQPALLLTGVEQAMQKGLTARQIIGVDDGGDVLAEKIRGVMPEDLAQIGREIFELAGQVQGIDDIVGILDEGAEPLLAQAQLGRGALRLGDVFEGGDQHVVDQGRADNDITLS